MALEIVSRREWGAEPPKSVTKRAPSDLSGVAIHWFGKPRAAAAHDGCAALLRGVQTAHMAPGGLGTKEGANDIGYNHAICPHGVAFDLRGFEVRTGANGDARSNRDYAAVVYMAGKGDVLTDAGVKVLAELIRRWQAKGAGPLVKPHHFFVRTECPGPELTKWIELQPSPWLRKAPRVALENETPPWFTDFIHWRLVQGGDPKLRPKSVPKRIPTSTWEALALTERLTDLVGPQQSFLDWVEWRRRGGGAATRPRTLPTKIPKAWVVALERLEQSFAGESVRPVTGRKPREDSPGTKPARTAVSVSTTLLAQPRATRKALERYVLARKHGTYSDDEVREILALYWAASTASGIDPLLVVSQLVLETGNLTSRWSQPPRRNPAGIGVTGAPGVGISFASWDDAVTAHVGRLLAYAVPKGKESSPAQRRLIAEALKVRSLPDSRRGCAASLEGLAGTWAMDQGYAGKLVRIANEITAAP